VEEEGEIGGVNGIKLFIKEGLGKHKDKAAEVPGWKKKRHGGRMEKGGSHGRSRI